MKKILILLISLVSCVENKESNIDSTGREADDKKVIFFPKNYFKDTLYFNVTIDHCGEWGGPEEEFIIYMDSVRNYYLNYRVFRFNCDSLGFYYGKKQILDREKIMTLNDNEKKAVSNFLLNMMNAKIDEELDSNAGSSYRVFSNDSTLNLDIHSTQEEIEQNYYKFKLSLGLPENRKKEIIVLAD